MEERFRISNRQTTQKVRRNKQGHKKFFHFTYTNYKVLPIDKVQGADFKYSMTIAFENSTIIFIIL